MNFRAKHCMLAWAALLPALAGCPRADLSGPPTLSLGRDECAHCGMLLNEERCASAAIVRNEHGETEYLVYDDIGCMLDREEERGSADVQSRYVRDYDRREWIDATQAIFLRAPGERIRTPMGSGIVAFTHRSQAQPHLDTGGAELFADYAALTAARAGAKPETGDTPAH